MGCAPYLDLQVLEFMKLELIETPGSRQPGQEMPSFFKTILCYGTMKIVSVVKLVSYLPSTFRS